MNILIIFFGKIFSSLISILNLGSGGTWPGHIALYLNKNFIRNIFKKSNTRVILVAGTNGKTTTSKLIRTILEKKGFKVFQNEGGANLLNGIASAIIKNVNLNCKLNFDFAIFETDENTLPLILNQTSPDTLVMLNLFRDQLDRYGEVNIVAQKWKEGIKKLPNRTILILNADDPQIAYLGNKRKNTFYFGMEKNDIKTSLINPADSILCPNCSEGLYFQRKYFSHLGLWECKNCELKRPKPNLSDFKPYPLPGTYNIYNVLAAALVAKTLGVNHATIRDALRSFSPVFGRQEKINIKEKTVQIFLSKNPTSFNESLRTIVELGGKNVLFVLNDRIPDGRDVSWIWDTSLEEHLNKLSQITISGDRAYDMGLRIKYAGATKFEIIENLSSAIDFSLKNTDKDETLFIVPTYSAMLETRKILTGRKIL